VPHTDFANYTVNFNFDDYYAQPIVKYAGNNITGIEQIVTQKYLAFFMNSGMEAYFNYIRTGFPKFMTGVGTGNSGRIAVRWQYPLSERTTNETNYNAAIQSQFAGKDDINQATLVVEVIAGSSKKIEVRKSVLRTSIFLSF
jgi:hypothetical protein